MVNKSVYLLVSVLLLSLIVLSCSGAKTEIIGEWQDDSYQKGNIEKILMLGIVPKDKPLLRRNFENGMVSAFKDAGVNATASMDHMPYDEAVDSSDFEKYFKDLDLDAIVVSRLVGMEQEKEYKQSYMYTIPYNSYYGFYGYYYAGIAYANSAGYLSQNVVVMLETNIYETTNKKLIWSGVSETVDPDKASDVIKSFGAELVGKLKSEGYFK